MQISLKDKKIIITGGTGCLGEEIVNAALSCGAEVFFTFFSNKEKAVSLEKKGAKAFLLDIRSSQSVNNFIDRIKQMCEHVDALINNAAIVRDSAIFKMTENNWDEVFICNYQFPVLLSRKMKTLLCKSKRGKIINVLSRVGKHGAVGQANYAAAKGALLEHTKIIAEEYGKEKILVNAVTPGFMLSGLTNKMPEKIVEQKKEQSCLNQYSNPKETAAFITYLLSDYVRSVSGQVFHIDSRIFP